MFSSWDVTDRMPHRLPGRTSGKPVLSLQPHRPVCCLQSDLRSRWAEEALKWLVDSVSRHAAARSHQVRVQQRLCCRGSSTSSSCGGRTDHLGHSENTVVPSGMQQWMKWTARSLPAVVFFFVLVIVVVIVILVVTVILLTVEAPSEALLSLPTPCILVLFGRCIAPWWSLPPSMLTPVFSSFAACTAALPSPRPPCSASSPRSFSPCRQADRRRAG